MREKKAVQKLINLQNPRPFVYACGRYPSDFQKTTVAYPIAPARNGNVLVFDLRVNLEDYLAEQDKLRAEKGKDYKENPSCFPVVKELKYNHCPAVAPTGVLSQGDAWNKIQLSEEQVNRNLGILGKHPDFIERVRTAYEEQPEFGPAVDPESALYDGFLDSKDANLCATIRASKPAELTTFMPDFQDERLPELYVHYKARNFENLLSESEQAQWEKYRLERLKRQSQGYMEELQKLAKAGKDAYLLEELQLWYQSLLPY